jgi:hypothetical protein
MVKWFRKKPVKVQAVQFSDSSEILSFCPEARQEKDENSTEFFIIKTPEGDRRLDRGEWLLRGPNGSFYRCEPDIMEEFYEEII